MGLLNLAIYNSTYNLPKTAWNTIMSTGDLRYLYQSYSKYKPITKKIIKTWAAIKDQFYDEFGEKFEARQLRLATNHYWKMYFKYISTGDKVFKTKAAIALKRVDFLKAKMPNKAMPFSEEVQIVQKYMQAGFLDPDVIPVAYWERYIVAIIKENERIDKLNKKNGKSN